MTLGFQVPSIGRWPRTQWDSGLTIGAQMKVMILLQNAEKKKADLLRDMKWLYEILAMLLSLMLLNTMICWWLYWNSRWCTNNTELVYLFFQTYLNWGTKWLFDSRNKYIWELSSMCMLFVILLVQGSQDIEWIF